MDAAVHGAMRRGTLRIYLGAAPGVGKTFAMLDEGRRRLHAAPTWSPRSSRRHGRTHTEEQLKDLSPFPRQKVAYRGASSRRWTSLRCSRGSRSSRWSTSWRTPTCPASGHQKRWQDVEALLDAGIDVISTVNIQHLESLNDVVEAITGIRSRRPCPTRSCARPSRSSSST